MNLLVFITDKPHFIYFFFFHFELFDGGSFFKMQNILGGWRRNLMRKTICASIFRLLFTCSEILFLSAAEAQLMVFVPKKSFINTVISRGSLQLWQWWQHSDLSGFSLQFQMGIGILVFCISKRKMQLEWEEQPQNNPAVVLLLR